MCLSSDTKGGSFKSPHQALAGIEHHHRHHFAKTNLEIIKECDNFPYKDFGEEEKYEDQVAKLWKFYLPNDKRPHGYLLESVTQRMPWTNNFRLDHDRKEVHLLRPEGSNWHAACNMAIDQQLDLARAQNFFPKLGAKRNEYFPIIGANFELRIERSAGSLFGVICRGVHMIVYSRGPSGIRFWIAQRNLNKAAYPGKLDNAVAGGIAVGEEPLHCLIKEAEEEAGFDEETIRRDAKAAGTITWFCIADENGGGEPRLINPGISYVYDMEVPNGLILEPVDGDIKDFFSMDLEDVKFAMRRGYFKPLSANVMMDFLIRHKYITRENEKGYEEIVKRLHRELPFPTCPSAL
ncbi:putative thiamine pyrophosphokinase [Acephala macrosclerotiorum]|nr:putative thiamine pyrophosphokinase [Acephala macrosclerotiorum]